MNVRCVVTGHDDRGRSVVKTDGELEPVTLGFAPGVEFHRVWGADRTPSVPDWVPIAPTASFFPPVGGSRVIITTFPVQTAGAPLDLDMAAVIAEAERKVPGMLAHMEPENPGMHTTNTVDVDIVLAGEVVLELDDGVEAVLRTGDMVVQNGTRHRWHNRGSIPAVLAAFLVGADNH
jgi:mannose-6-phosphate isomerase-like protein (cupin superfamily)